MKVNAFICDVCSNFSEERYTVGIKPVEDLFDKYKGYPTVPDPNKADIHYCMRCYKSHVYECINVNRTKEPEEYHRQINEYAWRLRELAVMSYNSHILHNKIKFKRK